MSSLQKSNHDNYNDNKGWTVIKKGTVNKHAATPSPYQAGERIKTIVPAYKNRYGILLETNTNNVSLSSKVKHTQPKDLKTGGSLKCYKTNQRRKRNRAAARALLKKTQGEAKSLHVQSPILFDNIVAETKKVSQPEIVEFATKPGSVPLPKEIWVDNILSYLSLSDLASFGACNKEAREIGQNGHHWQKRFASQFPDRHLSLISKNEWQRAYKLVATDVIDRNRCNHTKESFLEATLGLGIDFTVNPKTKCVDYITTGQDLMSSTAFQANKSDVFGSKFKLFLPLYFSPEHFDRSLPTLKKTIVRLCPNKNTTRFEPNMVLDVFPKMIKTFAVLVSDEGVAASKKSFIGLMRIHRLFLALAELYPIIKANAIQRLKRFISSENARSKDACRDLGNLIQLLMIVDEKTLRWSHIAVAYVNENFDRQVMWVCKEHPELEKLEDQSSVSIDQRLTLTREASKVGMSLGMLMVNFLSFLCKGTNQSRAAAFDQYLEQGEPEDSSPRVENESAIEQSTSSLKFSTFRSICNAILNADSWQTFYSFMHLKCPPSKAHMANVLQNAVRNSLRKKYHKRGMNFSAIHASGTSRILAKGQKYSALKGLQRVVFNDHWTFIGGTIYLDATCLLYKGKQLMSTVDYCRTRNPNGAVTHSGDVMEMNGGSHTIHLDLNRLDSSITSCVFVLSAFDEATLMDVKSASISFQDVTADESAVPLCAYHLDAHDKVPHLKSVIMCKLYRTISGWHVLAIGDSHRGSADNYKPIYDAAKQYL